MNQINLIFPLNGLGSRFSDFSVPKPLIKIFEKEMFFWLLDNLDLTLVNKIIIPYNRILKNYDFETKLVERYGSNKFCFICVPHDTCGAAETLKYAIDTLDKEQLKYNFMCMDCDTFYYDNVIQKYADSIDKNAIYYFEDYSERDIFSFIQIDNGYVKDIVEKKKISNFANCGIFCFENGFILKKYTNLLLNNNIKQKNEFYISGIYDLMIRSNIKVSSIKVQDFYCVGTPTQLYDFIRETKMHNDRPFPNWNFGNKIGVANAGEDDFFINYFNSKKNGIIIDVGAADGVTGSNSYRLINELNWKGILIEPLLPFYQYLNKIYKNNNNVEIHNCALDESENTTKIYFKNNQMDIGLTSLIEKWDDRPNKDFENSQTIVTKKFNNLIKDTNIDILSLDTEAKDWDIIKSIDFDKYNITLICTEIGWIDLNNKIFDFLHNKGYSLIHKTADNFIFEKRGTI